MRESAAGGCGTERREGDAGPGCAKMMPVTGIAAGHRLYADLASWWPLISAPEEYAEEAATAATVLNSAAIDVHEVLELGSGGGHNAVHLKQQFRLTLVDLSADMLEMSRRLNPECAHLQGDMRTLRLGRTFDAVFVHDAVAYMTTEADLRQVTETAFAHCRPGGIALFVPDHTTENFEPVTDHGGSDGPDGRGARYLEWTWDPDPTDTWIRSEYAFLLRDTDGSVRVVQEEHRTGRLGRPAAHHLEHLAAAGAEEPHQQRRGEQQENDVEVGRVVPLQAGLADLRVPGGRDQPERTEREFHDVGGDDHGGVEGPEYHQHHLGAVVLPVDEQDRDDDQVGEDERDDAAEADAPVPQHRRQRHVADRADEAEHRDHRADERPPQLGGQRLAGEEQVLPEAVGHPGAHRPGDQQADDHVADDGGPLHHEDLADRGVPVAAGQAPPEGPAGGDGHVHGGVP